MASHKGNLRLKSVLRHLFLGIVTEVFVFKRIEIILPKLGLGPSKEAPKQRWEVSVILPVPMFGIIIIF